MRRRHPLDGLDNDIRDHIERETDENVQRGMPREDARLAALRSFGGVLRAKEDARAVWIPLWLEQLLQDVRYAVRMLSRNPGFAATVLLTLALGLGANTAIFSIVDGVLLNPVQYEEPDRLVTIYGTSATGTRNTLTYLNFLDFQRQNQTLETMAAWRPTMFHFTGTGDPELLSGQMVSAAFFAALRVPPLLGRTFREEEDRLGGAPVVVLGEAFWKRRLASDPGVIDTNLTINGRPHTVIGLVPQSVRALHDGVTPFNDVFTPLGQYDVEMFRNRGTSDDTLGLARLKPGVTLAEARADLTTIAGRLETDYPASNAGIGVDVVALTDDLVADVRPALVLLLVSVGVVLLIACANVGGLLLARSTNRIHEFALRSALGADRRRIIRQLLVESLLLSVAGGLAGVLIAIVATEAVLNVFPAVLPGIAEVSFNGRVLAASLALAVATGMFFGLFPAVSASAPNLYSGLQIARGGVRHTGRRTAQSALVVAEVALTLVLLVSAGLMIRSLAALLSVDPGFVPRDVLTFYTHLSPEHAATPASVRRAFLALEERMAAVPGVESASTELGALPFSGGFTQLSFRRSDRAMPVKSSDRPSALFYAVGADYFTTMAIPLRRGRAFSTLDGEQGRRVMVVDEELARTVFPNEDPIGKHIHLLEQDIEIVGIAGHVKHHGLADDETANVRSQMYVPHMQFPDLLAPFAVRAVTVVIKSPVDTLSLLTSVRRALSSFEPSQAIVEARRMDDVVAQSLAGRRFSLVVLGVFAATAIVLSIVGLYGVVTHLVAQRTQEFGVRFALGATPGDVLRDVLGYGLRLVVVGSIVGLAGVPAVSGLLRNQLYGVSAIDPATLAAVTVLFFGVTLLACYVPARRATTVDPVIALRSE
ncbi:MAG: ADOP family duplicated permease [Vicinamibacterales bacterium]